MTSPGDSETLGNRHESAEAETLANPLERREKQRLARRHPDIEIARLLVKRGFVEKSEAVAGLKRQKARAKAGKTRVPFLRLLVKREALAADRLEEAQDEIRRNTYLCDRCNARAVILAGSQSRAGACPRCGQEISVTLPSGDAPVRVREFARAAEGVSDTMTATESGGSWRPLGSRWRRGLTIGEVAFERYLVQEELGRGAMGVVYRARHMQLDKPVALKVLFPEEDSWEHQVARFRREAAAVQKLKHGHIVAVHDFGSDGDLYYLTMDLVEGGDSLHTRLKRTDDPPSLKWRLETLVQVARAAAHAHERGIIHRDLKPANVLLDAKKGAQVADFGLAKDEAAEAAELTRTHDRLGTPLFMAPEQIRRGAAAVDKRADVWALGVMLFVCVTGRYPFRSRTVMDLYLRILREQPDWHGDRYSAPDRKGFYAPPAKSGNGDDDAAESVPDSALEDDDAEGSQSQTEIDRDAPRADLPETVEANGPPGQAIRTAPFAPPPDLSGELPPDLKLLINCALAKDPDDRYPSADAFADDVEAFLAGRKVSGGGPSALKRLRMQFWRRRVLRPLVLALALLAVAVGLLGAAAYRQREAELERDGQIETVWARAVNGAEERQLTQAEAALTEFLTDDPDQPRALARRGMARLRLFRLADARLDLDQASGLAGNAARQPARLQLEVGASRSRLELLAGNLEIAFRLGRGALDTFSGEDDGASFAIREQTVTSMVLAALQLGESPQLAEAQERCAALCADPRAGVRIHCLNGRLALHRGDAAEARVRLTAAERVQDAQRGEGNALQHLELLLLRASVLLAEGNPSSRAYRTARRAYPDQASSDARFLYQLQYALYRDREWERNLEVNRAIARLTPWTARCHYFQATALLHRLADADGALTAFRSASELDPYDSTSRDLYLALLLARRDRPRLLDEAAGVFRREELDLRASSSSPPLRLAYVLIRQERLTEAWQALDRSDEKVSQRVREKGLRSALARAAILRVAGPDQLSELAQLSTWRDTSAAEWEAAYVGPFPEYALLDALEIARIYLESGKPALALALLDGVDDVELDQTAYPKAQRMTGALLVFKAWALAALGKPSPAAGKLRAVLKGKLLPPEALPGALASVSTFRALLDEDPALRDLVDGLSSFRRSLGDDKKR